jgi:hypothetical protein
LTLPAAAAVRTVPLTSPKEPEPVIRISVGTGALNLDANCAAGTAVHKRVCAENSIGVIGYLGAG